MMDRLCNKYGFLPTVEGYPEHGRPHVSRLFLRFAAAATSNCKCREAFDVKGNAQPSAPHSTLQRMGRNTLKPFHAPMDTKSVHAIITWNMTNEGSPTILCKT